MKSEPLPLTCACLLFAWLSGFSQVIPFDTLFNGEDLTGWNVISAVDDDKDFVSVQNGAINITSDGGHGWLWLMSEKEYTDFVLKLKFSAPNGDYGNSGVNFRSQFDEADDGGYLNGPQVDIYPRDNWRTGLILDMTRGNERWLQPDLPNWNITPQSTPDGWSFNYEPEWNDLEIHVIGTTVTTIVNGITYVDEWDGDGVINSSAHQSKGVGETGYFALQAHSGEQVQIAFKDIYIQDLTNGTPIDTTTAIDTYSLNKNDASPAKQLFIQSLIGSSEIRPSGIYFYQQEAGEISPKNQIFNLRGQSK